MVVSLKKLNKIEQLYCNWNPRVLGLSSCSYSWFLFSSYFAFSSFFNFYFIFILLDFALFLFFWGVPGFDGVFRVFLGFFGFSWECSGFFGGVPECSVMFRCSVFLEVPHAKYHQLHRVGYNKIVNGQKHFSATKAVVILCYRLRPGSPT